MFCYWEWGVALNDIVTLINPSADGKYPEGTKAAVKKIESIDGQKCVKLRFKYKNKIQNATYPVTDVRRVGKMKRQRAGQEPGALGQLRKKLKIFLEQSKYYTPQYLLDKKFSQQKALLQEKAIVLSRVPNHEEVTKKIDWLFLFLFVCNLKLKKIMYVKPNLAQTTLSFCTSRPRPAFCQKCVGRSFFG